MTAEFKREKKKQQRDVITTRPRDQSPDPRPLRGLRSRLVNERFGPDEHSLAKF